MAEWSKAPRSGRGLSGGVGSNPTAVMFFGELILRETYKIDER